VVPRLADPVSLEALKQTWAGLTALMGLYQTGSSPWATLCEARRLVEVEARAQYGYKELGND
jgi:hypothetical protein